MSLSDSLTMRSSPTGNNTLLRIQREISEVAERENELRTTHISENGQNGQNGVSNGRSTPNGDVTKGDLMNGDSPSPPPGPLTRAVSTSSLHQTATLNGNVRRFIPNTNARGVMQKFFKSRGKITAAATIANVQKGPTIAWQPSETIASPTKALIPTDKPLRRGYVPVEERIQKELRELKNREEELKTIRRKSQPDLMAALEAEQFDSNPSSRSASPPIGKLRPARSFSHLLDDDLPEDTASAPPSLRPARSLAELCDAADEEIESPRSLIQQWETRIKLSQGQVQM